MTSKISITLVTLFIFITNIQAGSNASAWEVPKLDGPIVLDGHVDESAWLKIPPLPLTSHWPAFGNSPSDSTVIRVAYDDNYLYVSGMIHTSRDNILAASFKRDLLTLGTDYLGIFLDTFNDNDNALEFDISPTGSRTDLAVSNDGNNGSLSWNTFWDADAVVEKWGWSGEMRIPFSSLGFQEKDGQVVMGMGIMSYVAKKNELNLYPATRPDWGFNSFHMPSKFKKIIFKDIKSSKPVYVTPYALGGLGQQNELNDDETTYTTSREVNKDIGLDVRYNITNNLTLDFSANTDFAQAEADDQQVNLTRFSLFFPEKRRFFLERASIFDFNFGGSNRLFYTRRIGLNDGNAIPILGGGRIAGRIGKWDMGVLNVQTSKKDTVPAQNFGVVRLKRQVFNPFSYLGSMFTSRIDAQGQYNLGYGLDGVFRLFGDDYLLFNIAQTANNDPNQRHNVLDATRVRLLWERRSYNNFAYNFSIEGAGKDYNPVVGFESRENFTRFQGRISYGWNGEDKGFLQRHQFSISTDIFGRNADGTLETFELTPKWRGAFAQGGFFNVGMHVIHEKLREGFSLSDDVDIQDGSYRYYDVFGSYETPNGQALSGGGELSYGTFFDGKRFSINIYPKWIVSKHLELNGYYQYDFIDFATRGKTLSSHLLRLKGLIALNTKLSLSLLAQYSNTARISLVNARFRYNPAEGNDLYIVYNEQFNADRRRELPVRPLSRNRALLAKYTYTFTF